MHNRILVVMALLTISGCDNVPGQYRHDQNHHDQQNQQISKLESLQNQKQQVSTILKP